MQPLVSSLSAGDCLVYRLRKKEKERKKGRKGKKERKKEGKEEGREERKRERKKEFFINRCIRQSPADSDDTRGCIYTFMM
jgi:hypothetical protein